MSNMNKMDALLLAAILGDMGRKEGVSPLTARIIISPMGICGILEVNKKVIEDFHAEEWLKETDEMLAPIMRKQTEKFLELVKKKFNVNLKDATDTDTSGASDPISDMIAQAIKEIFGGGGTERAAVTA